MNISLHHLLACTSSFLTFENTMINMNADLLLNAIAKHILLTDEEQQQLIAVLAFKKVTEIFGRQKEFKFFNHPRLVQLLNQTRIQKRIIFLASWKYT